eukprot:13735060-Heterocapsa_arctica.AAC.1
MNTQTIDGVDFILDKECIILLYCNKRKWGDTENHYDLMHPTIQQICKTKTYTRRSELQHIEHQQQEDKTNGDRHRQTLIGEEQTKQTESFEAHRLGPKEDVNRLRDCTARQNHDDQNKRQWYIAQAREGGGNTIH